MKQYSWLSDNIIPSLRFQDIITSSLYSSGVVVLPWWTLRRSCGIETLLHDHHYPLMYTQSNHHCDDSAFHWEERNSWILNVWISPAIQESTQWKCVLAAQWKRGIITPKWRVCHMPPQSNFYQYVSLTGFVLGPERQYWCSGFESPSNAGHCGFERPVWQFVFFWSTYGVAFALPLTFFMQRSLSPLF